MEAALSPERADDMLPSAEVPMESVAVLQRKRRSSFAIVNNLRDARQLLYWYEWFPFINLVYEFLFDEPPTVLAVEKILNIFGLVTALLLGVVLTIPASVNHAELAEANMNFNNRNSRLNYTDISGNALYPTWPVADQLTAWTEVFKDTPADYVVRVKYGGVYSNRLAYFIAGASGSLTSALLSVVLSYFFLAAGDWDDDGHNFGEWWHMVKWLVLHQFAATAVGIVLFFLALMVLMDVKFPDDGCPNFVNPPRWGLSPVCIGSYFSRSTIIVLWTTVIGVLTILSLAATKRYLFDHRRKAWLENNPDKCLKDYVK